VHIGTDPAGWQAGDEILEEVAADGDSGIPVVAGNLDVHILGAVARMESRGRFTCRSGCPRPVRATCVLACEQGRWAMAQSHASIGVPNADIFR